MLSDKDKETKRQALIATIDFIKRHEPCCICEQCPYGYKSASDIQATKSCLEKSVKIDKEHKIWENRLETWEKKLSIWEEKMNNAE